jgi:hypothetical protein
MHTPERAKSRITEEEILEPGEYRTLMAQCSMLVMIASIVVWLMVANAPISSAQEDITQEVIATVTANQGELATAIQQGYPT